MKWRGVYWNRHGCPSVCPSIWPSVCPWTQFCPELFSYSFACTALKFINNVCIHMKLCMCNFQDILSLVVELSPLELVNFTEVNVVQRNYPTVLHVLNSVTHNATGSIQYCMCNFHYHTVIVLNYLPLNL